jgi:hypothetical protein
MNNYNSSSIGNQIKITTDDDNNITKVEFFDRNKTNVQVNNNSVYNRIPNDLKIIIDGINAFDMEYDSSLDKPFDIPGVDIYIRSDVKKVIYKKNQDEIRVSVFGDISFIINGNRTCSFVFEEFNRNFEINNFYKEEYCFNEYKEQVFLKKIRFITLALFYRKLTLLKTPVASTSGGRVSSRIPATQRSAKVSRSKTAKHESPVKTARTHKGKDGVIRRLYKKGQEFYVKIKSKITGKFGYRKVKV